MIKQRQLNLKLGVEKTLDSFFGGVYYTSDFGKTKLLQILAENMGSVPLY